MKFRALLAIISLSLSAALHAGPPAIPIEQALKIAQDHLAERGLADAHYIGSLVLEESTLGAKEPYWFARWTPYIKLDGKSETGLRINMDGSLFRLTAGGVVAARKDAPGVRRAGARNIR